MESREKVLYHQIHPAKLLTDFGTAMLAALLLWKHELLAALLLGWVPSVVVSAILIRRANLDKLRDSALGRYIARYMTRAMEVLRFVGLAFFWGGAWLHALPIAIGGFLLILAVWGRGKLWPRALG